MDLLLRVLNRRLVSSLAPLSPSTKLWTTSSLNAALCFLVKPLEVLTTSRGRFFPTVQIEERSLNSCSKQLEGFHILSDTVPGGVAAVARWLLRISALTGLWIYTARWDPT